MSTSHRFRSFARKALAAAALLCLASVSAHGQVLTTSPSWSTTLNNSSSAVAIGDIDRDGDLDLVFGNSSGASGASSALYLNEHGALATAPVWISELDAGTVTIALGDVDGDGDLDLVCGNGGGLAEGREPNTLFLNDGGSFLSTPSWTSADSSWTMDVALGDVDGDGDLDLVCGNLDAGPGGAGNVVYFNVGGTFEAFPGWTSIPMNDTRSVALGDIDGDGDVDLACGNGSSGGERNTLYLNRGGVFETTPSWTSSQEVRTSSIVFGDVNGDGRIDLVCGNEPPGIEGRNVLYLNDGALLDTTPAWYSGLAWSTISVVLGDADGDGDLDVACGNRGAPNTLYLNDGGVFEMDPVWSSEQTNDTEGLALGDVDGDGDLELVAANGGRQSNKLYDNLSPIVDTLPSWSSTPGDATQSVVVGDVDNDGDLDLVSGNGASESTAQSNALYRSDAGRLRVTPDWRSGPMNNTRGVAMGDLDGDGLLDLVCANDRDGSSEQQNTIYVNRDGTFEIEPSWHSSRFYRSFDVALGDVDGDGDLDIVFGNWLHGNTLYLNDGGVVSTTPVWQSTLQEATHAVALGDVDGDGDLDLACGNTQEPNCLYLNEGGTFGPSPAWTSSDDSHTGSVVLGDVDGDGDLDLVCGNGASGGLVQSNTVYLNRDGMLDRTPMWASEAANATLSVVVGDLDGDGALDLVAANAQQANALYRNSGNMFETSPSWRSLAPQSNSGSSVALADLDRDGDLDVVVGQSSFDSGSVLYAGRRSPVYRGDPSSPTNQLPNNDAHVNSVFLKRSSPNVLSIGFTVVDIESDPVWIVPEFQYEGEPAWMPVSHSGEPRPVGPLASSPAGIVHGFDWDILALPFDRRPVTLRLRVVSNPARSGIVQRIASFYVNAGVIQPSRGELDMTQSQIDFGTVTAGDTASSVLTLFNVGTTAASITGIQFSSPDVWPMDPPPFTVPSGGNIDITLFFAPAAGASEPGELRIESNDPLRPVIVVPLKSVVRPLDFSLVDLYPDGIIDDGKPLNISIVMQDSVHIDSARALVRAGGQGAFWTRRLSRLPDPANDQFSGAIPADSITSRGVEYLVEVYNGRSRHAGALLVLRKRVTSMPFAYATPASKYRMTSVPLEMDGTMNEMVGDDLGGKDPTRWRLFEYDHAVSSYREVPDETSNRFVQGHAYWIITKDPQRIDTGPAVGLSTPTDEPFVMMAEPGWNMIGNPFNFAVAWDSVDVNGLAAADAEGVLVDPPVGWVAGRGYDYDVDRLDPFDGYWIRNRTESPVELSVPAREVVSPAVTDLARESTGEADGGPWRIRLGVHVVPGTGGVGDPDNYLGVEAEASEALDRFDRGEPPMSPGRAVSLYFPHAEWENGAGIYATDIRPPVVLDPGEGEDGDASGGVWLFDVAKNFSEATAGEQMVLQFGGLENLRDDLHIVLIDRYVGHTLDLRESRDYTFYSGERRVVEDAGDARFALIVGDESFVESQDPPVPMRTALGQNYPNPFNPTTRIRYELADAGRIKIVIYDVRGALVKVLEDRFRDRGRYEVRWNGRDDRDQAVASGIYFYRMVTAGHSETKKMLLLK